MSNNEKSRALKPKLRFPEFREAGEWGIVTLEEASVPVVERVGTRVLPPVSISAGVGFVSQAEKFGRDISGNQYQLYTLVRDGDFVYNKGNSLKFPEGCVYLLQGWGEVAAPNVFISFRLKEGYSNGFFQNCFEQNIHGKQLRRYITSGARSNGLLNISKEHFFGVQIPVPSPAEQQKIAACLSTLDATIAAHAQKLGVLQRHKKALMQQLFPREGETQPRLRFPEFRAAGDWEIEPLENVCEILNSRRRPITSNERVAGPYPYYGASGIVDFVGEYIFAERLLLVGEDGAKWGAFEKTAFIAEGKYWVNNHAHVLKSSGINDTLLENYLTMINLGPFVTGAAPPKLTLGKLKGIPIPVPPCEAEQQKIAACLSTLDACIAAQARRLGVLQAHKRGLMQGLFPNPAEDET